MIRYRPRFPGPIQGYATNTIKHFYPALCADHEFDDLLQEAYIVFMKCSKAYMPPAGTLNIPAHFMNYFKRGLTNKLINMAAKCHPRISIEDIPNFDIEAPGSENVGYLSCLLAQLPSRTRYNIGKFLNGTDQQQTKAYIELRRQFRTQAG